MTKRIFIWVAHPKANSLCAAIADAYQTGVDHSGGAVQRMDLNAMVFDTGFDGYGDAMAPLEPDLVAWQQGIGWADHLLFIHPCWWGAMPAQAKTVLDRALLPGFGFHYHRKGIRWDRLLTGKSADAIITSDTPPLLDTLLYRKPARRVMRSQVLGFCGIRTKHAVQFGSVKTASAQKIDRWLSRAERMGARAAGAPTVAGKPAKSRFVAAPTGAMR